MGILDSVLISVQEWITARSPAVIGFQLLVVAIAAVLAWFIHRHTKKTLDRMVKTEGHPLFRQHILKIGLRLAFPLSTLIAVALSKLTFYQLGLATPVLDVVIQLLAALAIIRLFVYALRAGIAPGPALKAWEKAISTGIWVIAALHILGWYQPVHALMDGMAINFGENRISLLAILIFVVLSALYILLALWLSGLIEQRMKESRHVNISMRVGLSKIIKFVLLTVAVLLALTEAGLNLSTFAVFGGALGVGIGFGLQKIVSNFISGFILLGDRSISPGDVISIGENFGWVKSLRARYIVVRNRDGVETLIPNENLVTSEVINWSYSDKRVRVRVPVQISYDDDPEQAMDIMVNAAGEIDRVLKNPAPSCNLMEFADSGIALELRVWLTDPEAGVANIRSRINLAIWRGFKEAGITIPYPQRDVNLRQVTPTPPVPDV